MPQRYVCSSLQPHVKYSTEHVTDRVLCLTIMPYPLPLLFGERVGVRGNNRRSSQSRWASLKRCDQGFQLAAIGLFGIYLHVSAALLGNHNRFRYARLSQQAACNAESFTASSDNVIRRLLTYGGSFMVLLTTNQTAASTAPAIKTNPAP